MALTISGPSAGIVCVFTMTRRGPVDPHLGRGPALIPLCLRLDCLGSLPGAVLVGFLPGALSFDKV
ncbi:hypothetical protein KBY25_11820 [Ruegeria pomeroyi]|nr:hypothetical protein [Ruegeria pomeroyi]